MGNNLRILSTETLPRDILFNNCFRTEIAEFFHVHWRDLRILMNKEAFATFLQCAKDSYTEEDFGVDRLLSMVTVPGEIPFNRELKIEEIEGGYIHFHYGDLRLELEPPNFIKLANLFIEARRNYCGLGESVLLPISSINPYDHIHKSEISEWESMEEFKKHVDGTELFAQKIQEGYQICPIIVTKNGDDSYQRRDGFKRYMAYWTLRYKCIPSFIVSENTALTCPQHGQYPFIQKGAF